MHHAKLRAVERYGTEVNLGYLTRAIHNGTATFAAFAHQGREVYDVPYLVPELGEEITVRALVEPETKRVISILPPKFRRSQQVEHEKHLKRTEKQVKKKFFRDLVQSDDTEEMLA